ncbi:MAG TPA: MFS transporter [Polyangiaceae bacterium]
MLAPQNSRLLARAIIASQFGPPFMFSGVAVALPSMGADLGAGATALGLIETLFLAGSLAFLLPLGRFADVTDKRTLYKLGMLSFGLTSILTGTLSSVPAILAARFVQGVTSALLAVTGPAILTDIVPPERRGRAYGSSIGAIYVGLTLGPIVAGFVVEHTSWRGVFLLGGAVILLGLGLVHRLLDSSWRKPNERLDLPSTALIVTSVLCLVAGSASLRLPALASGCFAGGMALAAAFVIVQQRMQRPLLDVRALVRNRELSRALLVQLLLYINAFSSVFMLSIYMQVSLGHSTTRAGQVLATGSVLMAAMAPVAGRLADRYPARWIAAGGVLLVSVSALGATRLDQHSGPWTVISVLAVQGLGFALFSSPNMTIIMRSVPVTALSTASALSAKARSLGIVFGMLAAGTAISLELGDEPVQAHPLTFIAIMSSVFGVLTALSALALLVSVLPRAGADR